MDKRYQVFVSSTFTDLKDERSNVIQTLMEMDCIPAGMELFPAIDEEQWEFIKKIIDDCDYYLLIIGGRYGSVAEDGLSYTEKEFDYAVSKGIKIVVLTHENRSELPVAKSEVTEELRNKLESFIEKASTGRLRKTWSTAKDLPGLVALSMTKTIKTYPAVGWVKADKMSSEVALLELNDLRKRNDELEKTISELKEKPEFIIPENVASLHSYFEIHFHLSTFDLNYGSRKANDSIKTTWEKIFFIISPFLSKKTSDSDISQILEDHIKTIKPNTYDHTQIDIHDLKTIYIQFKLLGFLEYNDDNWASSTKGKQFMLELRAIKE